VRQSTQGVRRLPAQDRNIYGITEDDRELVAAPLFHEAPALFALLQIFRGGTVVVTSDSSPAKVFEMIDQTRATWTFMVPTMWASMVASEEMDRFDLGSLRLLLSGGSPLLTHTKDAILRRFPKAGLNEFYGATEVGPGDESLSRGPTAQGSICRSTGDRNVRRAAR
jgi:acyl-CoA synthetase (AMP-forming)/AMP-acid ligase II